MRIELSQAYALLKLCNRLANEFLPPFTAYKIAKLCLQLDKENHFYQVEHKKYLDKYALRDGDNYVFTEDGNIKIIPGLEEECKEKFKELNSLMIDIEDFELNLREIRELKVTVAEMMLLVPFIKE